ncbi:MAG: dihydroorotase [Firmicutes bacterium]|nr:dihydroorotase [Bacillota bacterium]
MNNWYLHDGLVFRGGRLKKEDILILHGRIAAFGSEAATMRRQSSVPVKDYDAGSYVVSHGFIDLHVHLREPGFESKETIESGTKAAAAGGFTTVYAMPNTEPPLDSVERLFELRERIKQSAFVRVEPIAAVTKNRAGREINDLAHLVRHGVSLFSDDGDPVESDIIKNVMEELAPLNGVLINHLEEKSLLRSGLFCDSIPPESEYLMLERDLKLVAQTNCRYHAAHLSCAKSVELIGKAKQEGLPVTAEVTPHHLTLTKDDIAFPEGNYQMKPPLRTETDRLALIEGLRTGVIDAVATDHAPHGREKDGGIYSNSPFGVTGLETAFPVLYSNLVLTGQLELERLLAALTTGPAKLVGQSGELKVGEAGDIVVLDLECRRTVEADSFYSKGTNSPYIGQKLQGWPVLTLVNGVEKYSAGRPDPMHSKEAY